MADGPAEGAAKDRYVKCVPLLPLKAAAGAFSDPQHVADDDFEWVEVDCERRLQPGILVAQVVGRSMEPGIEDGAYCLFVAPVTGSHSSFSARDGALAMRAAARDHLSQLDTW